MDQRTIEINNYLRGTCYNLGFIFIDNDNITRDHLVNDGVHLTEDGSTLLAKNLLDSLNSVL